MGKIEVQAHIDNDNVLFKRKDNDIDIVSKQNGFNCSNYLREKVLKEITEWKLDHIQEYLYGGNNYLGNCGAFVNLSVKQAERCMYIWMYELSEEARKIIIFHKLQGNDKFDNISYKDYTNSPLWKYMSSVFKMMHGYCCARCNKRAYPAHLVVHHLSYDHVGSEFEHLDEIQVLCKECHAEVHGFGRNNECEQ